MPSTIARAVGDEAQALPLSLPQVKVESANWGSVFVGVAPRGAAGLGWHGYGFLNYRAVQARDTEREREREREITRARSPPNVFAPLSL